MAEAKFKEKKKIYDNQSNVNIPNDIKTVFMNNKLEHFSLLASSNLVLLMQEFSGVTVASAANTLAYHSMV
jgi:hypothetical protein